MPVTTVPHITCNFFSSVIKIIFSVKRQNRKLWPAVGHHRKWLDLTPLHNHNTYTLHAFSMRLVLSNQNMKLWLISFVFSVYKLSQFLNLKLNSNDKRFLLENSCKSTFCFQKLLPVSAELNFILFFYIFQWTSQLFFYGEQQHATDAFLKY